jgi:hypothetical protein
MSPPEPCMLHVPLLSDSLPVRLGPPISAQVHPAGQLAVGVGLGIDVGDGVWLGVGVGVGG